FEVEAPFSKISVISYPNVVTSDAEAQAAAKANNASVVVWGTYTADQVQLSIQIGVMTPFPDNQFDLPLLQRTANIRVQMKDETQESIAPQIIGVIGVLEFADGSVFGYGRTLAALDSLRLQDATIVGDSVAAHIHRYFVSYLTDPGTALNEANQAVS